jgi:ribosomal protein L37AE/L43A
VADTSPQRAYRAACPGCGAPVEFRSAQSAYAVCSFCRSTIVRDGATLSRIGKMAEVFEDYSPLQIGASGRWEGQVFTLVGRLQYKGETGTWTEWHAVFDDGASSVLAEDNGSYVFSRPSELGREAPPPDTLRIGATTSVAGKPFSVASNLPVSLISAQGELPKLPPLGQPFVMVELRSSAGEVVSIDYGVQPPVLTRGVAVQLEGLQMSGLRDDKAKTESGRQFSCPNCGAPVEVTLAATKSITCRSCHSIIDLTQGIGGELTHATQDEPVQPLIPLGSSGQLQGVQWQVVGYQHRMGHEAGDDDEAFGWEEYLLYNAKRGFSFLVDAEDGWSIVKPTTGAPALSQDRRFATYLGQTYNLLYAYEAETNYVAGEFYWPVERGQKTFNRDFAKGGNLLSMEESPKEVTWSSGGKVASETIAAAFKLQDKAGMMKRGDAGPVTPGKGCAGMGCGTIVLLLIVVLIILLVLKACVEDTTPSGYYGGRTSGGSYGGYSGGGGHK